jgi:hypothetical protein
VLDRLDDNIVTRAELRTGETAVANGRRGHATGGVARSVEQRPELVHTVRLIRLAVDPTEHQMRANHRSQAAVSCHGSS